MPSLRSYLYRAGMKIGTKMLKLEGKGMEERRKMLDDAAKKWAKLPKDCQVEAATIEGLYAEWITNSETAAGDKVILYLHGGGYEYCSAETHRPLAARIMEEAGVRVLLPEYRLAPEHPFPAAIEDSIKIYKWLLNQGFQSSNIMFAGDSAGGGLSVAAALTLRDQGEPLPAAVICLSPWVDLTSSGESYVTNKDKDPYLSPEGTKKAALMYAAGESLEHELISPIFADFRGFPPLFIQAGSIEILQSDAEKLANQALKAGVNVRFKVWEGMWHVWQITGSLPEARKAIAEIGNFIRDIWEGNHS
jgi:monoterpene epsilon-lactone hydrolase